MIGNKIERFESIESTNNYIKNNSSSLEEGTIVISKTQTSGRGRSNHTWMSEKGNLYFSFLLNGYISRSKVFELLIKVSNAVVELLNDYHVESKIKYPNDILVGDKKISGILIESYGSKEIDYVVVGVGINVNQLNFKEINDVAISMKSIKGIEFDIDNILSSFIKHYNKFEGVPFNKLFDTYLKYSLIIGKRTNINGKIYLIKGISDNGKLMIENSNIIEYINLNEISIKDLF